MGKTLLRAFKAATVDRRTVAGGFLLPSSTARRADLPAHDAEVFRRNLIHMEPTSR